MLIKFQTNKVLEFLKLSNYIETVNFDLAPIQRYIKVEICFGSCIFTKTNSNQYITYTFDIECEEDHEFLLLEEGLSDFAKNCQQDKFTIEINEETGYADCTDGYYDYGFSNGICDIKMFNVIPDIKNENPVTLDRSIIVHLNIAKPFIGKDEVQPYFMNAYISDNYMYASDGQVMYIRELTNKFPFLSISAKECDLIKDFEYVDFVQSENYNNFICKNTVYGFINKTNAEGFDYKMFLNGVKKGEFIKFRNADFINFCQIAITASVSDKKTVYISSKFSLNKNNISFSFDNNEYNKKSKLPVSCENSGIENLEFMFFAPTVLMVLKSYPYKEICLSDMGAGAFVLWGNEDKNFVYIIRKQA